jgi:membrane protein
MVVALVAVSAIQVSNAQFFGVILARFPWLVALQTYTFRYIATVLLILGVGLVFYFIPNAKTRFRDVWVGAVLTGVLWRLALAGFSQYVRDQSRFTVHGSIGGVVVFLLWVYVSAVIFLFGAEVTAAYARLRRHRPEEIPAAPSPRV